MVGEGKKRKEEQRENISKAKTGQKYGKHKVKSQIIIKLAGS
ncbi:hypothetical protein ES708_18543 [subsurface metagenome]